MRPPGTASCLLSRTDGSIQPWARHMGTERLNRRGLGNIRNVKGPWVCIWSNEPPVSVWVGASALFIRAFAFFLCQPTYTCISGHFYGVTFCDDKGYLSAEHTCKS